MKIDDDDISGIEIKWISVRSWIVVVCYVQFSEIDSSLKGKP